MNDDIFENGYLEVKKLHRLPKTKPKPIHPHPSQTLLLFRIDDEEEDDVHQPIKLSQTPKQKNPHLWHLIEQFEQTQPHQPQTQPQPTKPTKKYSFQHPHPHPQPQSTIEPKKLDIVVAPSKKPVVDEPRPKCFPLSHIGPFIDWREKNYKDTLVPDGVFFSIITIGMFYGKYNEQYKNIILTFPNYQQFKYQSKRRLNQYFNENWGAWSNVFEQMTIKGFRGTNTDYVRTLDYQKFYDAYLHYKQNRDMNEVVNILRPILPPTTEDIFVCNYLKELVLFHMVDVDDKKEVHERKYVPMALIDEVSNNQLRLFWNMSPKWRYEPIFHLVSL